MKSAIGKILYGLLFMALLPAMLILWTHFTTAYINLPVPSNPLFIFTSILVGLILFTGGMHNLWFYGKGLPMNAYPPKQYVSRGVFSIVKNPIYTGTLFLCFGVAALAQSASGFWLVSPLFTLMIASYTLGFENERTALVFGEQSHKPLLSLPEPTQESCDIRHKAAAYLLAYLPWCLVYEAFIFIGVPKDAMASNLAIETSIPFIPITTILYVGTYLFAVLIPFIIQTRNTLRNFIIEVWIATGIAALMYFLFPFVVNQAPIPMDTFWGKLLSLDRKYDGVSAALPAFHLIWALIAAKYYSSTFKKLTAFWYLLALLMSLSCLTTKNHTIPDVMAAVLVVLMATKKTSIWQYIKNTTERIANSWKTWRIGKLRIINHGIYGGLAGFLGVLICGSFLGEAFSFGGFLLGFSGIIGAGLWAQLIEGSPKLQRPFGYYGSVVGVFLCSLFLVGVLGLSLCRLLAASAFAATWVQIIGRLRCLVQGCCHGKPVNEQLGICFIHPLSRVNKISGLKWKALHPTQLYSIATNLLTFLVLYRLYSLNMSANFITGMYLILNGLGRFVEESFRGETQTPYWANMRIYQWIALLNVVLGAFFTCIPSAELPTVYISKGGVLWAFAMGLFATFAYGVDFPESNKRFARLTSE